MTGHMEKLQALLQLRLNIVARISAAQADYLKQQQLVGGLSFGAMLGETEADRQATENSIAGLREAETQIANIEDELRHLDETIESMQAEETRR